MSSAAAARPKCPSSATVTKNRRWRIRSMAGDSISTGGRFADPACRAAGSRPSFPSPTAAIVFPTRADGRWVLAGRFPSVVSCRHDTHRFTPPEQIVAQGFSPRRPRPVLRRRRGGLRVAGRSRRHDPVDDGRFGTRYATARRRGRQASDGDRGPLRREARSVRAVAGDRARPHLPGRRTVRDLFAFQGLRRRGDPAPRVGGIPPARRDLSDRPGRHRRQFAGDLGTSGACAAARPAVRGRPHPQRQHRRET